MRISTGSSSMEFAFKVLLYAIKFCVALSSPGTVPSLWLNDSVQKLTGGVGRAMVSHGTTMATLTLTNLSSLNSHLVSSAFASQSYFVEPSTGPRNKAKV